MMGPQAGAAANAQSTLGAVGAGLPGTGIRTSTPSCALRGSDAAPGVFASRAQTALAYFCRR